MMIRHSGNLRQMRDADDLLVSRKVCKLFAHALRRDARHAGIHLVEHHGRYTIAPCKHILERQHDAAQLAAGCDLADASGRLARVRREQESHGIRSRRAKPRLTGDRSEFHLKPHPRHRQIPELRNNLFFQLHCGASARFTQRFSGRENLLNLCGNEPFQLQKPIICVLDLIQSLSRVAELLNQAVLIRVILALQTAKNRQTVLNTVVLRLREIQSRAKIPQRFRRVLQGENRIVNGSRYLGKLCGKSRCPDCGGLCLR